MALTDDERAQIAATIRKHSRFVEAETGTTQYGYAICAGCGERRGDAVGLNHLIDKVADSVAARVEAAKAQALEQAADAIDRGPTFPISPSIISALVRERAAAYRRRDTGEDG